MARGGSRRVVATVDDDEEEDDAVQEAQCCVCAQVNARVTVVCAACAKTYHLACHSPPLRRRPGADTTWECSQCTNEEKKDTAVVKKRRRDPAVGGDDLEKKVEKEETNRKTKTRRAAKLVKRIQEESEEEDGAGESDEPLVKEVKSRAGKKPTETKAKVKAKAPRKSVKVQEPELAFKRLSRAAARSKVNAKSKASVRHELGDDEEEDGASEKDDENDSDFSVSGSSDGADDDDTQLSATDDEFEPPVKLPSRKKPHQPRVKKAPARKQNKRAPRKNKTGSTTDDQTVSESPEGDVENAQGSSEEDEVYTGPSYRIEYAPNGRASCKSCEQKLPKGILRVGIRVKHSMFGITTYFKHLECTQICLNETSFKAENGESDTSKDTSNSNSPDEPIRGFGSLQPKDKTLVQEHMKKNAELGLLDERRELSEDQYTRKTRMPEKEPSPHLTAALLPYQREALAWMTAQEQSDYKGGILADEMGMGKTIQAISLILENPRDSSTKLPDDSNNVKSKGRSQKVAFKPLIRGGTLVVCPVVAVMQWKSEIERFVERNHLTIYVHHGAKRMDLVEKIASYDIVLTTYSIIENEVRKTLGWEKVPCKYCKKKYLPDKLILHNKYFCGPNAKKTALQDRQKTKKKGKKAAGEESDGSDDDLKKNVKSKVPAKKKRGKKQEESEDDEDDYVEETAKQKAMKGKSPMHQIHWTRIVLDEAHYIKDRRCNTARGVFELKSDYKWCLTGTPLQNRIGELFSLIRFLQIKFYAYYHCSKCECQMLDFNFPGGKCVLCPHPAMHHFSYFNKKIVIPIQSYGYVAEGKVAMLRLQNELLQHILLRRTKEGRADDISLPPKLIRVRRDRLDERENDFYQAIYTQSQAQFNTYVSSGTLLNNYAHIFDLLIRLRQAVDHPYLVIYSKSNPALQISVPTSVHNGPTFVRPVVEEKPLVSVVDEDDDNVLSDQSCVICHEDVEDPVEAKCGHVFCRECVKEFIESLPDGAAATCPDCDNPLTVDLSPPKIDDDEDEAIDPHKPVIHRAHVDLKRYSKHSILHRISDLDSFQTSTKIEALMQELEHMKQRDPSGKAIIFSQFVNMLDIIQHRLTIGGIKCVKLSGNMSMDLRDRTIRAFREDNSVTAFLISLKAGGVALNLTIASHIFLMDPWWNPAAENQAIDRTHRLGQFKPVQATRFIIAGTIEERILKLQQKKQLIFEGTVGASVSAICRLTEDDLRFLFSK